MGMGKCDANPNRGSLSFLLSVCVHTHVSLANTKRRKEEKWNFGFGRNSAQFSLSIPILLFFLNPLVECSVVCECWAEQETNGEKYSPGSLKRRRGGNRGMFARDFSSSSEKRPKCCCRRRPKKREEKRMGSEFLLLCHLLC